MSAGREILTELVLEPNTSLNRFLTMPAKVQAIILVVSHYLFPGGSISLENLLPLMDMGICFIAGRYLAFGLMQGMLCH